MPVVESFEVALRRARTLSPSVRELVLARSDGQPWSFEPGQWINLDIPLEDGATVRRAYSIASAPNGTCEFELAVTRVIGGPGSEALHALSIGQTMRASGPQGFFVRAADDPSPALLIGTGTGMTPLRSMVQAALGHGNQAPLTLLLGFRHEEDVLYRDELASWQAQYPQLSVSVTLSQPRGSAKLSGYVQTHAPEIWRRLGRDDAHIYICGLDRMVRSVRELFRKELEVGRKQVHQERYD